MFSAQYMCMCIDSACVPGPFVVRNYHLQYGYEAIISTGFNTVTPWGLLIVRLFQSVGVYAISAANMALHFELLAESQGGCPIPVLFGDPETGNNYNVTARNVSLATILALYNGASRPLSLIYLEITHALEKATCTKNLYWGPCHPLL